jgi:arylsulfate sulfotransferase
VLDTLKTNAFFHLSFSSGPKTLLAMIFGVIFLANCGGSSVSTKILTPAVLPTIAVVRAGALQSFSASFGSASWSINGVVGGNETVGTMDNFGVYTAPSVPPSPDSVTITATSTSDPSVSASATVTVIYPPPLLSSLSPVAVVAGSGDTTVTLTGQFFYVNSVVSINGTPVNPTYSGPDLITVTVPASYLANPSVVNVTVSNQSPGGGSSVPQDISVISPGQVSVTKNPLVANYTIDAPGDALLSVEFGPDTNYGFQTWKQPVPSGGGQASMLVAGMRQGTTYHMRAILDFPNGSRFVDTDKTFTTGTLDPSIVPPVTVTNPSGLPPSPGILMGHLFNYAAPASYPLTAAAFDLQGQLIWYYDTGEQLPQPIKLLPNGHFLVNLATEIREIDLAGNLISSFSVTDLNQWLADAGYNIEVGVLHHDFLILPNGHLILLAEDARNYTDLPGYPGTTSVVGDDLIDVDASHHVQWFWSTFDHLDVNRLPEELPDWTHGNAVIYSPDDGDIIYSSRHQSWVIKIKYQDGKGDGGILWRLGYQGDFTLDTGKNSDWQYCQHYPALASPTSAGLLDLVLFDNGDNRVMDDLGTVCGLPATPGPQVFGTPYCYSRAVDFRIDENTRTVSTAWQYNASPVYSFWGGSTQKLSTGNYVVDFNTPTALDSSGNPIAGLDNPGGARYLELTPDQPPQVVLQLDLYNENAYRFVHMPSLYPGVQW